MITKEMTILEIVEKYPETEDVFRSYDDITGKCVLCSYLFDTIDKVSAAHNLKLDVLLDKINDAII